MSQLSVKVEVEAQSQPQPQQPQEQSQSQSQAKKDAEDAERNAYWERLTNPKTDEDRELWRKLRASIADSQAEEEHVWPYENRGRTSCCRY